MPRLAIRAAALLCALLGLTTCLTACSIGDESDPDALVVGFVVDPSWAQIPVAEEAGYFDDHGVKVKVVNFSTGVEALQALTAGQVDVTTAADVPASAALATTDSLAVVADGSRWLGSRIIAPGGSGIETIEDLDGKRIGTPLGTSAAYFAQESLAASGVDAELVQVAPSAMVTAVTQGDVDAISIFEPYQTQVVEALGTDAVELVPEDDGGYVQHSLYLANEKTADAKSGAMTHFFEALADASADLDTQTEAATESVARSTHLPAELVATVLDGFEFGLQLDKGELSTSLEALGEWAQDNDKIDSSADLPDYAKRLDDGYLESK